MIVCLCRGVSDRTIRLAVLNGADSVHAIADRCGAGSDCGSCQHAIQEIVDEAGGVASVACHGYAESGRTESGRAIRVAANP